MPRKTTSATLEKPAATRKPVAQLSAAELEQRTRESLESTRERLRILGVRLAAFGRERDALETAETEAGQHAADAWGRAHAAPQRVQAAKARLMALSGSAGEASALAELTATDQARSEAEAEAQEASTVAASVSADAAEKRVELDAAIAQAEAEERALLDLLDALERQAEEAHQTRGFELVEAAIAKAQDLAKIVAGRAALAVLQQENAQKRFDEHRAETLQALADYPEALLLVKGSVLEVPHPPTPGERIVEQFIQFQDVLEHDRRHLGQDAAPPGTFPGWDLLEWPDRNVLTGVLSGFNTTFLPSRRAQAVAWLERARQFSGQPQ